MIFKDIVKKKSRNFGDNARIIVEGVNDYRRKIFATFFPEGVPDPEIPFFMAALRLTADDLEDFAKRSGNHDKYMNATNDIVDLVNENTRTLTFSREVKNG